MGKFKCPHCGKTCKTTKGLEQHVQSSAFCQSGRDALRLVEQGEITGTVKGPQKRKAREEDTPQLKKTHAARSKMQKTAERTSISGTRIEQEDPHHDGTEPWYDPLADDFDPFAPASDHSTASDITEGAAVEGNQDQEEETEFQASTESSRQFKKYVRNAYQHFAPLEEKEKAAVELMRKLLKKKASLDTYEDVMEWHLNTCGKLRKGASLGKSEHFVSRKKLLQKLRKRYNMAHKYAVPRNIVLPHTKTKVSIWCKDARDIVQSLLTDPRFKDEDFLYFDNDPFAPPPDDLDYIGDLNTGAAYIETYKRLITKPNQILVGIPLYIDGAVTGQFDKLQITALKMTLGILNRKARDKEHAWRSLGFVTNYAKEDSRGQKIFVDSGHVAAHELYMDCSDEGEDAGAEESDVDKAADYHAILSVLMESLRKLIDEGMMFDIFYNGKLHKNCELVFFVPFVKCDGDEGDKLCASYRSRGKNVAQLCRYCCCPNDQTDDPNAKHKYKTEPMLKKLHEEDNDEKLQQLSQINIKNAFHGIRFGQHNNRGIHGACPWELLHAILLGIFMYCRDCFFAQMGKTSATSEEINALSKMIGILFTRQSERNKPRTKFAKGIKKGKLMAKEYVGVLLIMAAILRCTAGQAKLKKARKKNFREDWMIKDWILLVETLLQWEAYLMSDQMQKKHITRLEKKNRFVMFLLKKVGNRVVGMAWKVMKFHAIIHIFYDIFSFGVPMVVDTGSNESHHKTTKVAAKLTQKDITTFEKQTSDRCDDFEVLDLALQEIDGRPLWEYFSGYDHKDIVKKEQIDTIGGMMYHIEWDMEENAVGFVIKTRMKNRENVQMDTQLLEYLYKMQAKLLEAEVMGGNLEVYSEHKRSGQIFRAHPKYRGKGVWRDWVMINWQEGEFPAQIWGFLDLTEIPYGQFVEVDDDSRVSNGVYAIVESCTYIEEEEPMSDIFTPLLLETSSLDNDGLVETRKFYVVDVEAFKDPIVVIPNIGTKDQYLLMKPREKWADDFVTWLEMPHKHDKIEMLPDPVEKDSDEEEEAEQG